MAAKGLAKRQKLFEVFSKNLALYVDEQGLFICPICFHFFREHEVATELSLAHIWPKSLGGTRTTLACVRCNSSTGSQTEHHAKKAEDEARAFNGKGTATIPVTITLPSGRYFRPRLNMTYSDTTGEPALNVQIPKKIDSNTYAEHEMLVRSGGDAALSINSYDERLLGLAYLHAAHLALFDFFGYEWVRNSAVDNVRRQLYFPEQAILETLTRKVKDKLVNKDFDIHVIQHPTSWKGFFVATRNVLKPDSEYISATWMPLFGQPYKLPSLTDVEAGKTVKVDFRGPINTTSSLLKRASSGQQLLDELFSH